MKRLITLLSLFAVLAVAAPEISAQGFLKKLKDKAENAVGGAIMKKLGLEDTKTETSVEVQADEVEDDGPTGTPTATDRIPKLRQSSVVWDAQVVPSRASDVYGLLDDLPGLPSAEQITDFDEAEHKVYHDRIMAVSLRIDELDDILSCSDEELIAAREKIYRELEGILGLTAEEMERLDDPNISDAEKSRLEEKMIAHMTGGLNTADMAAKAAGMEGRLSEIEAEVNALTAKQEAGTITPAEQQRLMELSAETMGMAGELLGGADLGAMMNTMQKTTALADRMSGQYVELEKRLKKFADKAAALRKNEDGVVKTCGEIAAEYETELRAIYERVHRTEDADTVKLLYDQAERLVKDYRMRAAKVWLRGLQLRYDNTVALIPEAEKLYAEMAEAEMIPACATRRAPLNLVADCADILYDAYADFPQPHVFPFKMESLDILKPGDRLLNTESGYIRGYSSPGGDIAQDFLNASTLLIYNEQEDAYYKLQNGVRTRLDGYGPFDFMTEEFRTAKDDSVYGEIPLRRGDRKANYNRDGSLVLHDGTYLFPMMMQRYSDRIEFVIYDHIPGADKADLMKCTYKL